MAPRDVCRRRVSCEAVLLPAGPSWLSLALSTLHLEHGGGPKKAWRGYLVVRAGGWRGAKGGMAALDKI